MEQKKKDEILQKIIDWVMSKEFGVGSKSSKFSIVIDHENEKEHLEYSERT
mgnify:CR=1 FL=1